MSTIAPPLKYAALSADAKSADGWCLIAPAGRFRAGDGRPAKPAAGWIVADPAGLVAQLSARQAQMCVDYEHASLSAAKTGVAAPAAGWVSAWRWDDSGGLYAQISWCARAQGLIDADEYRYLSPVLIYDESSGAVLNVYNIALTNNPALDQLPAVQAVLAALSQTQKTQEVPGMEELLERLQWMLNMPVGATADDIAAQLQKLIDQIKAAKPAALSADGAALAGGLGALLSAQAAQIAELSAKPTAAGAVPLSALLELQQKYAALTATQAVDSLKAQVTAALSDGRLLPSMQQWADAQLSGTPEQRTALSAYLDAAVPMPALAGSQTAALAAAGGAGAGAGGQVAALTADEMAVCTALGIDQAAFVEQKTGGKS